MLFLFLSKTINTLPKLKCVYSNLVALRQLCSTVPEIPACQAMKCIIYYSCALMMETISLFSVIHLLYGVEMHKNCGYDSKQCYYVTPIAILTIQKLSTHFPPLSLSPQSIFVLRLVPESNNAKTLIDSPCFPFLHNGCMSNPSQLPP